MSGLLQVRNQPLLALDLLANGCTGLQGVEQVLVGCTGELVNMLQALADLTGGLALLVAGGRDLLVAVITLFDAGADAAQRLVAGVHMFDALQRMALPAVHGGDHRFSALLQGADHLLDFVG